MVCGRIIVTFFLFTVRVGQLILFLTGIYLQIWIYIIFYIVDSIHRSDKPEIPVEIQAAVNGKDVEVTWQPGDDNPVTNYYLEMKPEESKSWQQVNADFVITDTHFTVKNLPENVFYHFRVSAENKAGKSEPSKPSNSVMIGEPLRFIRELQDQKVTSLPSNVTLECELNRPVETVAWMKDRKPLTPSKTVKIESEGPVHRVRISEVKDDHIGSYTMNVEKLSTTGNVTIEVAPELKLPEHFEDNIIMPAGTSKVIEVPFIANPKPDVKWTYGPSDMKPRFKTDVVAGLTSISLGKVKREDSGDYKLTIKNDVGDNTLTLHVTVLDKPSPPRNLVAKNNVGDAIDLEWKEPEDLGGYDTCEYVVEFRDSTKKSSQPWKTLSEKETHIDKLIPDKSYVFRVAAKNPAGQSDFVETQPIKMKFSFDKPKAPPTIEAVVEGKDVNVSWQPGDDNPVTNYHLEMKPEDSKVWQQVNADFTITDTHFTVKNLPENVYYHFRVTAENKVGKSEPSKPSNSVMVGIPLKFIRELENVKVTELPSGATFECELSRPVDSLTWMKNKRPLIEGKRVKLESDGPVYRAIIPDVKEDDVAEYTASVEKLSSSANLSIEIAPELKLPEHFEDNIIMPAGTSKVIEVPFIANPKPDVKWTYGPSDMKPRFKTDVVAGLTSISLGKVKREDSGDYKLTIRNDVGDNTLTLHVTVLDKPSPPRNLVAKNNVGDAIDLEWKEPEDLGGYDTCEYVVEFRESTKKASQPWKTLSEKESHIDKLTPEKKYVFRVAAKNPAGQSDFVETQPILMKLNFNKPKTPIEIQAVVNGKDVEVTWQPGDDSPVTNYYLEMKPEEGKSWQQVNADFIITDTHFTVKNLPENVFYHFRVSAENKAGKSEPSKPSNSVMVGIPLSIVRELEDQKVTTLPSSVVLECELSRPVESIAWMKNKKPLVAGKRIKFESEGPVYRVVISDVKDEDVAEYTFAVEKLSTTCKITIEVAPEIQLPEHFEDHIVMKAGSSKVIEVPFIANPKPEIKWTYGDKKQIPRFKFDTVAGLTSLSMGKVKREDSGPYTLTITNQAGDNTLTIHLTVLDKPSPPRSLSVQNNVGDAVDLLWKEPEDFGGYDSVDYVVEFREISKLANIPCCQTKELQCPVKKLTPEKTYIFCVAARNEVGQSAFVESAKILMRFDFGK